MPPFCARYCAAASAWRRPSVGQRRVAAAGIAPLHGQLGLPVPQQQEPGRGAARSGPARRVTTASSIPRRLCGGLDFRGGVHRLVGQPVGVAFLARGIQV